MTSSRWRGPAIGGTTAIVLVLGVLGFQHAQHGWPFSLHHRTSMSAVPQRTPTVRGGTSDDAQARAAVELDPAKMDAIGVRIEHARRETISLPLRAVMTIVPDESRISHVHTRVAGWIEQLHVSTTGQSVRAGQSLAGIFSQELLASQNEYLAARRAQNQGASSAVIEGARSRLKVLGMTDAEIRSVEQAGEARRLVSVIAPRSGVVTHRGISIGTAVDPSTELLTVADLSQVWAIAELPEADIPSVQRGTLARLDVPGSGRAPFEASVDFLYPTLSERTRTLRVRFVLKNSDGALRPGLYGSADLVVAPRDALTVPRDAVVDTGSAQHLFVVEHEGHFVPRTVRLGVRLGERVEVTDGLTDGEAFIASGVFLIDSESRLRASSVGTGHSHGASKAAEQSAPASTSSHSGH